MAASDKNSVLYIPFDHGSNADPVKLAIPFIHCNMGGEMIYILEQRLYSQKIRKDKIERVLDDIIRQMFNPKVFKELLRPGPLPSNTYMRGIFHTIANTSIMKLSENSMEKMYELMVMGFKYQVLSLTHPKDLIAVTLNHIESNRLLTHPSSQARAVVDNALSQMTEAMQKMTTPQYHTVRWLLCKFFQDRRTKVSLFLREGLQTDRGYFPLQASGPMPNDELVEIPGMVRYYTPSGVKNEVFVHPLTRLITTQRRGDHFDFVTRDIKMGTNVYISQTDDQRKEALQKSSDTDAYDSTLGGNIQHVTSDDEAEEKNEPEAGGADEEGNEQTEASNRDTVDQGCTNFLGKVLGKKGAEKDTGFKFNPFGMGDDAGDAGGEVIEIQQMTRDQFQKINAELVSMMDELEVLDKVIDDRREGSCSSLLDLLREQGVV